MASQIGVTAQAVSRWESGAGMPDISLVVPIAQVLNVFTDVLFGLEKDNNDNHYFIQITNHLREIERRGGSPADIALAKCIYVETELDKNLGNHMVAACLVKRTADLSRYADFENFRCDWETRKNKTISVGTQVIRFCNQKEWLERTHFALTWIYIHERDFVSAREHIDQLPSTRENRLQESILAQIESFEHGVEGMKRVVLNNFQNYIRVLNKELLYAMEDMSWHDTPENTVAFGTWGLNLMNLFCEKKELIPYCRGFFRDIYQFLLHADLRVPDYALAAKHWQELCAGMKMHFCDYQELLTDEVQMSQFNDRQINYMKAYTEEFITEKQQFIKDRLREWHGEEVYARFAAAIKG